MTDPAANCRQTSESLRNPVTGAKEDCPECGQTWGKHETNAVKAAKVNAKCMNGGFREARTRIEHEVSLKVVRGTCMSTGAVFSGCIISGNRILSTAHQLFSGALLVEQDYKMSMLVEGRIRDEMYSLTSYVLDKDEDYATFARESPVGTETVRFPCFEHFERPIPNDHVYCAARCGETCAFILSEGTYNYSHWVTAFADNGWGGGPVFHLYDGHPTLVGLVRGSRGTTHHSTSISLVPKDLLTNQTEPNCYAIRAWKKVFHTVNEGSSTASTLVSLPATDTSSSVESPEGKRGSSEEK